MSLISMAVHDTDENKRTELTRQTIECLTKSVDWNNHRLIIIDNDSCKKTRDLLRNLLHLSETNATGNVGPRIKDGNYKSKLHIIPTPENIGTSRALNLAWKERKPGEHVIKIDNDVIIHSDTWVEEMEEAITRDPKIGIIGLKRKDIIQTTWHPDPEYRSELIMLPHEPGQRWICIEKTQDIIGTCTMFNSALLDKVGYSYQPGLYGYEDVLISHRSRLAGFYNCFLNHINIDHIDQGGTLYMDWKQKHSSEHTDEMIKIYQQYLCGERSIYEPFY